MKILIFGARGQLGLQIKNDLKKSNKIICLNKDSKIYKADFRNPKNIIETISKIKPEIIINAAAYTSVDKSEVNKKLARTVNAITPNKISSICKKNNILLIHFSSDYVFSGIGNTPWLEKSLLRPKNYYGMTKKEADTKILLSGCKYVIFRTSWVYSENGNNFLNTIIKLSKNKKSLNVIDDQIGAPTSTKLISSAVKKVVVDYKKNKNESKFINQIYNIAPDGYISWFDFAIEIIRLLEKYKFKKKLKKENIFRISSKDYFQTAKRPLNSRLNTNKVKKVFDLKILPWQEYLKKILKIKLNKI